VVTVAGSAIATFPPSVSNEEHHSPTKHEAPHEH
jgi:hypothetical protein